MSTNRSRRIDRDAAEQLLGGAVGGPSAGQDASLTGPDGGPGQLARVLAAAAAPATVEELAGEEAALAAFRKASLAPDPTVTPVRRRSMATAALARAFSTKATAVVLGTTALCGVAVAAGTGNLPSPLGGGPSAPEHGLAGGDAAGGPVPGSSTVGPSAGVAPFGAVTSGAARPSGGPQAVVPSDPTTPGTPSAEGRGLRTAAPPALLGLCTGFTDRAAKGERPSKLVGDPLYGPLVTAAGGADQVTDYCKAAIGDEDGDHQGATTSTRGPGRPGTVPGAGAGKGNSDGGRTGGSGNGNGSGGAGDGNADGGGNGNGQDTGGAGTRPGKSGVTLPPAPTVPGTQDVRPSKPDRSENQQSAER
ncbi:hypothetical protein ACGF13_02300 [Kitasatospora sp. NPDC048286]|uniref:hypothetical protein n=1 Tax=Kitasatospora sp. NPDC048286 TaxID=3364047 RepID=UPI0037112C27